MALSGYMKVKISSNQMLDGECLAEGREKWIRLYSVDHTVALPKNDQGLPNGKRVHHPIVVLKEIDTTSPVLYQCLSNGEILEEVVIEWYRINKQTHKEEPYFRQTMSDVQINKMDFAMKQQQACFYGASNDHNMGHMEQVSLIYDRICWLFIDSGIEFCETPGKKKKDSTQAQQKAQQQAPVEKHMVVFDVEPEKSSVLPPKHKVTYAIHNTSQDIFPVEQTRDITQARQQETKPFKLKSGEKFDVFVIPESKTEVIRDLKANGNLKQSKSKNQISALQVTNTETRSDGVIVHNVKYIVPPSYDMAFQLVDENGKGIKNIPVKTQVSGTKPEKLHLATDTTDQDGKTQVVSTTENESVDLYISWAKLNIDKSFIKTQE